MWTTYIGSLFTCRRKAKTQILFQAHIRIGMFLFQHNLFMDIIQHFPTNWEKRSHVIAMCLKKRTNIKESLLSHKLDEASKVLVWTNFQWFWKEPWRQVPIIFISYLSPKKKNYYYLHRFSDTSGMNDGARAKSSLGWDNFHDVKTKTRGRYHVFA